MSLASALSKYTAEYAIEQVLIGGKQYMLSFLRMSQHIGILHVQCSALTILLSSLYILVVAVSSSHQQQRVQVAYSTTIDVTEVNSNQCLNNVNPRCQYLCFPLPGGAFECGCPDNTSPTGSSGQCTPSKSHRQ